MKYTFVKYDQLCHSERSNEIAKSKNLIVGLRAVLFATIFLAACGDDNKNAGGTVEDGEVVAIVDKTVSGVSQKGPFVNGSSVTVQELDGETLAQTGLGFEGKIKNDMGEFSVKVNKLESPYALLKANGFYRNEVTGEKSKSQVTLYALTDLSDRDEVNVNLLTHLAYERSLYLATTDTLSVAKAKKQAEAEVLKSFGIEGIFASAEDLNIFGESDQSAALLAVSVLMQGSLSEGDFSERLADYAADIENDGVWNDSKTATKIADWANAQWLGSGLAEIRENIIKWSLSADVPAFEKYANNFWWQNYGLGTCNSKREGEVLKNKNKASVNVDEYYICQSGAWNVASDIEKDTYMWLDPTAQRTEKDGDVRYGDVIKTNCYVFEDKAWRSGNANDCSLNLRGCTKLRKDTVGKGSDSVWHVCHNRTWWDATTYEKDTFGWKDSTDGAIKKGNVTDSVYVFDKTAWRVTSNVEAKLGGCVSAIADSVGKVGSTYYVCKSNKWVEASAIEYDTYRWTAGKDGDSKVGSVNANNCYVYENKAWRSGNKTDCSLSLRGCTALRQDTVGLGSDKVWHICDAKSWRNATTYEKDTFGWKDSTDGAIKKGNVTDSIYVFDKTAWRVTSNVEAKLGGCVSAIADSIGKVGSIYYICKSNKWIEASAIEYDTYRWATGKDGDSKLGSVNTNNCYVYENSAWRSGNTTDCSLGLRGCTALRQDTVGKGSDNVWFKCDAQAWRTATDIEKDTATWGVGEFDGEVRAGQINTTTYYIYGISNNAWRNATTIEKDTYDYVNNSDWTDGADGEIKKGTITDTIYVFDESVWRVADGVEKILGGCVTAIQDSVGKVGNTYYICTPREWVFATELQYDTYKQNCTEFGQIIHGNENKSYAYFCYGEKWKRFFGNESVSYGKLEDERDGQIYRTVKIGGQTWMAENLNYSNEEKYLSIQGKYACPIEDTSRVLGGCSYTWAAVIDSIYWLGKGKKCGYYEDPCSLPSRVQGICPPRWHMPNAEEFETLYRQISQKVRKIQALGYDYSSDESGFSALSGGCNSDYQCSFSIGPYFGEATFWAATEMNEYESNYWIVSDKEAYVYRGFGNYKNGLHSVRCVKDEE